MEFAGVQENMHHYQPQVTCSTRMTMWISLNLIGRRVWPHLLDTPRIHLQLCHKEISLTKTVVLLLEL